MSSIERSSSKIDFSKIPVEHHDFARVYLEARNDAPLFAASVRFAGEVRREAHQTQSVEKIMEADIEYAIAEAEHYMNFMILLDQRSGIVSNAITTEDDSNPDPRGYLGEVE